MSILVPESYRTYRTNFFGSVGRMDTNWYKSGTNCLQSFKMIGDNDPSSLTHIEDNPQGWILGLELIILIWNLRQISCFLVILLSSPPFYTKYEERGNMSKSRKPKGQMIKRPNDQKAKCQKAECLKAEWNNVCYSWPKSRMSKRPNAKRPNSTEGQMVQEAELIHRLVN